MPTDKSNTQKNNTNSNKRKRVNRMKTVIVVTAVILLFASVIMNFILVFKVLHLESQINQIYSSRQDVISEYTIDL